MKLKAWARFFFLLLSSREHFSLSLLLFQKKIFRFHFGETCMRWYCVTNELGQLDHFEVWVSYSSAFMWFLSELAISSTFPTVSNVSRVIDHWNHVPIHQWTLCLSIKFQLASPGPAIYRLLMNIVYGQNVCGRWVFANTLKLANYFASHMRTLVG